MFLKKLGLLKTLGAALGLILYDDFSHHQHTDPPKQRFFSYPLVLGFCFCRLFGKFFSAARDLCLVVVAASA
jgi:hypothetical protein